MKRTMISILLAFLIISMAACGNAGECPKNFTNVHVVAVRTF